MTCAHDPADGRAFLDVLHRGHDGYLSFHRKRDDHFEDIASLKAADLGTDFEKVRSHFDGDCYFSVNGFWCPGRGASPTDATLRRAHRRIKDVRWLTACFVDLDAYKVGRSSDDVIAAVTRAMEAGALPWGSYWLRSGRGAWIFWLLADSDGGPTRASYDNPKLYACVQSRLCALLAPYGADSASKDAARICRIPGTSNSKVGRLATAGPMQPNQRAAIYGLEALAVLVGAHDDANPTPRTLTDRAANKTTRAARTIPRAPTRGREREPCSAKSARGRKGYQGRVNKGLRQFETLRRLRGGFREGHRHHALYIYGLLLKAGGRSLDAVRRELRTLGGECSPPLSRSDCDATTHSAPAVLKMRNATIADWLEITPSEAEQLEGWPAANSSGSHDGERHSRPAETRRSRQERRRAAIWGFVLSGGSVPTAAQIAEHLATESLTSHAVTVLRDLRALGLLNPRSKAKKPLPERP